MIIDLAPKILLFKCSLPLSLLEAMHMYKLKPEVVQKTRINIKRYVAIA